MSAGVSKAVDHYQHFNNYFSGSSFEFLDLLFRTKPPTGLSRHFECPSLLH